MDTRRYWLQQRRARGHRALLGGLPALVRWTVLVAAGPTASPEHGAAVREKGGAAVREGRGAAVREGRGGGETETEKRERGGRRERKSQGQRQRLREQRRNIETERERSRERTERKKQKQREQKERNRNREKQRSCCANCLTSRDAITCTHSCRSLAANSTSCSESSFIDSILSSVARASCSRPAMHIRQRLNNSLAKSSDLRDTSHCGALVTAGHWSLQVTGHCGALVTARHWSLRGTGHCGALVTAGHWSL